MAYDYREAIREDVKAWIDDNYEYIEENVENPNENRDGVVEFLNDTLWTEDSVTGNASGSYTFSRATAREYVEDNMELAVEAFIEFDCINQFADAIANENYEAIDVTIRCYLLGEAIEDAVDEAIELARGE